MPRTDVPLAVLVFVLAVWGVTGVLCLVNWYRRRGTGVAFLEILRFTTMGMILFTLCKPEYDREKPREEDKEIDVVILADRSGSMATPDVDLGSGLLYTREQLLDARLGLLGALTREEPSGARVIRVFKPSSAQAAGLKSGDLIVAIDGNSTTEGLGSVLGGYKSGDEVKLHVRRDGKLLEEPPTTKLADLPDLLEAGFSKNGVTVSVYVKEFDRPSTEANASRPFTDINTAIINETTEYDNLRAMMLLSDGDRTEGKPPTKEATRVLRDNNVTLHTVTNLGSLSYPADLELELLEVPSFGFIDDRIAIPFRVKNHLVRGVTTNVFLRLGRGQVISKRIEVKGRREARGSFIWPATREGDQAFQLNLPVLPEEFNTTNNLEKFSIRVQPNTNNVLVIESRPRWEYRYLRNALTRDPDV
ncbi:MAG: PDZ domain-containing protein, partial [Verrucomicrobiota bacterium]|nr:PDZ domain-containing protein [Verrucomicrobiota bacterium]